MKLDLWARLTKLGLSGKSVACCMSSYLVLGGFCDSDRGQKR